MSVSNGRKNVSIAVLDGPFGNSCKSHKSSACAHGTHIASVLFSGHGQQRGICSGCSLVSKQVFQELNSQGELSTSAEALIESLDSCIEEGIDVVNLSATMSSIVSSKVSKNLGLLLDKAMMRGMIIVAAAGNYGLLSASVITKHPWVLPVVACDEAGKPANFSTTSIQIAKNGIMAPGTKITGLAPNGNEVAATGTSFAVPFVSGALALLISEFPRMKKQQIRREIRNYQENFVYPPLLNAWKSYEKLKLSSEF